MSGSNMRGKVNKNSKEIITFQIPYDLVEIKEDIIISSNYKLSLSNEEIVHKAFKSHSEGNINEALRYYKYLINKGVNDHRVYSNYGAILKDQNRLKEAELSLRKAIEIKPDFAEAYSNLGNILLELGKLKEAELLTLTALKIKPDFAQAHSNLGTILKYLGKSKEAEKSYRKAIEYSPNYEDAHSNLGNILINLGKLKEAELTMRKVIEFKPNDANAHCNLGAILKDLGKLKEAEESYRKAIEVEPKLAEAHFNLGNTLTELGKLKEAEFSHRKAIEINPDFAQAYANIGNILLDLGKSKEAELSTRKAIKIKPDFAQAYSNLGTILTDLRELKEAELSTRKAIELNPNFTQAYLNLGSILSDIGRTKEAEFSTRKAIELNPFYAEAHSNLGSILLDLGKLKEAELSTRKAIELKKNYAEAYYNLSLIELLRGNYEFGLKNYEYRFQRKKPPNLHGDPIIKRIDERDIKKGKKILVISEQGLGDTIQFMRYIPYLKSQGLDISFCAQAQLHSLIKASNIDQHPLTAEQSNKVSDSEWIPLLSIPKYLKISPNNPIINKPYIFPTNKLIKKWRKILSKEKKPIIAINWQGNPNAEKGLLAGRSISLESFSRISIENDVIFVSLQKGFGSEQLKNCSFKNKFIECQREIDCTWDFLENAAIIENCDLVITTDTSIAHLAGGMGKKVWLLLKDISYWTWGLESERTFWYPSMRLFRQNQKNNWDELLGRVSGQLKAEIGANVFLHKHNY